MIKIQVCFTIPNGMDVTNTIAYKCYSSLPKHELIQITDITAIGASIGKNRNLCILNGRQEFKVQTDLEFDYYLFIDYDIAFNYDHIMMLLNADKKIITGNYPDKNGNGDMHAGHWAHPGVIGTKGLYTNPGIAKVDWCGGGFLMIHKSILEEVPYPWFRAFVIDIGDMATCTSEDVGFCIHMGQNNQEIWCNYDCKLVHMKDGQLNNYTKLGG